MLVMTHHNPFGNIDFLTLCVLSCFISKQVNIYGKTEPERFNRWSSNSFGWYFQINSWSYDSRPNFPSDLGHAVAISIPQISFTMPQKAAWSHQNIYTLKWGFTGPYISQHIEHHRCRQMVSWPVKRGINFSIKYL